MSTGIPRRILALRGGALGDCVATTPALRLLRRRFPASHITVIGLSHILPLLEGSPNCDRLRPLDHARRSKTQYLRDLIALRKENYDLLVDFQASGRSRMQTVTIGCRERIGFDRKRWLANAPYTQLVPFSRELHAVRRLARLLEPFGIQASEGDLSLELPISDRHRREAGVLLDSVGIASPFVVLQVTANNRSEHRSWPTERFVEVARRLRNLGFEVVLPSRLRDEAPIPTIRKLAGDFIHSIAGETSPLVLGAVLERAALFVGYNTGPMHVASACGTPIVGLFDRPHDAVEWHPWTRAPYRLVRAKEVDEPPGWRLDTVTVDEVMEAVDDVLQRSEQAADGGLRGNARDLREGCSLRSERGWE